MSKLLVFAALVGTASAAIDTDVIPKFASQLKGEQLVNYINTVQSSWKAKVQPPHMEKYKNSLMHIKHTRLPADVEFTTQHDNVKANIPAEFDARTNWTMCPNIGLIRDQSQCGSCWSFGAAEAMSDRVCIASGGKQQPILAAEDILSCCGYSCGYGCDGGYPIRAWNYWVSSGVCTGGDFYEQDGCKPYSIEPCGMHVDSHGKVHNHDCSNYSPNTPSCKKECTNKNYNVNYKDDKFYGKSAYAVRQSITSIQQEIMTNGPVEAAFTVYEDFYNYYEGVYRHVSGQVLGGHAVRILGWGTDAVGGDYWLVANSWNVDWGMDGYFKITRGTNDCGIEEAIVAGLPKV